MSLHVCDVCMCMCVMYERLLFRCEHIHIYVRVPLWVCVHGNVCIYLCSECACISKRVYVGMCVVGGHVDKSTLYLYIYVSCIGVCVCAFEICVCV